MAPDTDALDQLTWLVEAGADEAIGETARDHFIARPAVSSQILPGNERKPIRPPILPRTSAMSGPTGAKPDPQDFIGQAQAASAAAGTLADLKAAMEAFDAGSLKKGANKTVFADGNPAGGILLVGEAPGQEEDRVGIPFVGRAGKLLDKMLAAINLTREQVYLTNVINWRPPGNRNPTPEEAAMCRPFLRRHVELADPQLMVVLGGVALTHVMGISDGIMKSRGRWLEYNVSGRMISVMPTLHPAYLLRQPAHKKLAWRDLQAIEQKIMALGLHQSG